MVERLVMSKPYAVQSPEACPGLTAEKLREDGVFLWTNGSEAILFFGQRVPPQLVHATIGESTVGHAMLTPFAAYQASAPEGVDKTSLLWTLQACSRIPSGWTTSRATLSDTHTCMMVSSLRKLKNCLSCAACLLIMASVWL